MFRNTHVDDMRRPKSHLGFLEMYVRAHTNSRLYVRARTSSEAFTFATNFRLSTSGGQTTPDLRTFSLHTKVSTVGNSHKAQTIGTTRHLYALRPLVHSASYRPGRHAVTLDVNFKQPLAEASIGPMEHYGVWFPMQPSRLGSGLEAFSHNPSSGSITALSDRTTVDTRDSTWEFLSYYPRLLSNCTGPRAHSPSVG